MSPESFHRLEYHPFRKGLASYSLATPAPIVTYVKVNGMLSDDDVE